MTKIIGFLITKENKKINIDFFNVGLKMLILKHSGYYIYLWGIGDIENYKINNKYSLSFPLHDSLLDRNVLLYFEDEKIIVENDWLGSIPIFYNPKAQIVSTISNFCIRDKSINNEGLANFCEFGYSVFEQTMFTDIKFMRYFSKLIISNNEIKIEYKIDPAIQDDFLTKVSAEDDVIELMQEYISSIESKINGEIIIPTSGGYDSRLLNYLIKDKRRIRSFTYGISKDQSKSTEVVHAKKISEIYNTKWDQIELKDYYNYIDKWFSIYGISTHLHGMYHIEFYKKILQKYKFKSPTLLSGIIGDAWAEYGKFNNVINYNDVINLGYTHGLNLNLDYLKINYESTIKITFYEKYRKILNNDKLKAIFSMRIKLILLSYLTQIPEYFGMPVWTPFLNFDIVRSILNINDKRRIKRIWERDFFRKVGLNLEDMGLKSIKSNQLDYAVAKNFKFEPIDIDLMAEFIDKKRLFEVNKCLSRVNLFEVLKNELLFIPKIGGIMRRIGYENNYLKALYEYFVIKAIEKGLKYES